MGKMQKSRHEVLKELQEALLRVRDLEESLLESPEDGVLTPREMIPQEILNDKFPEIDSSTSTQTLDLTNLFSADVTSSGSYYTKGIGKTLFGRLLEALPTPALLVSRSKEVVFANRAWRRTSNSYEKIVGKLFSNLFPIASVGEDFDALVDRVFIKRLVFAKEAALAIDDRRIWGRITLRSIRLGTDKFMLVLVEDLTSEKKQLFQKKRHLDALNREIEGRKSVEKALKESQERLDLAMKGADLFSWDWDIATGSLICDKLFGESMGYLPDEIEPRKEFWEALGHPDDRPVFEAAVRRHLTNHSSLLECEHRVRTKTGEWKWFLTRGKVLEIDEQGRPSRALGTNLDITERKQLEQRSQLVTRSMIQAVEREREHISLDLHDQVAQDLAALRLMLETVLQGLSDETPELVSATEKASEKVREVIKVVRGISYSLRPAGLDRLGLVSTVRQYCEEFSEKHGIRAEFSTSGLEDLLLDFDTEINLFRAIQESLQNVAKHARATGVRILLDALEGHIVVRILDDGIGFDLRTQLTTDLSGQHMGLWCMEQRVSLLKGRLEIRSSPEEGTQILIEIPYSGGKNAKQAKDLNSG